MDLLLTPSLFENYFISITNPNKTEFEKNLIALIQNPNNRFVLSADTIKFIETKITNSPLSAFIEPFFVNIIDSQAMKVNSNGSTLEDEILDSICTEYKLSPQNLKKDIHVGISFRKKLPVDTVINLSVINTSKRDWALFQTCCYHPRTLVLHYFDFKNNSEINEVISGFFSLAKPDSVYYILDRQCNLEHNMFNSFQYKTKTHYYTTTNSVSGNTDFIKKKFKSVFLFCGKKEEIHERKVICQNLVLETDEDFWNIEVSRNTWKIDLTYCPKISNKLKSKVSKFKRKII